MVPLWCSALVGRQGCGHVRSSLWSHGDGWGMAAVSVICASWGSARWPNGFEGIGKVRASGLAGCLVRAVRRAAKLLLKRAVCGARAWCCVWMAGDTCPAANAQIWRIAKTGHKLSEAGRPAVRSWVGIASVCCRPFRCNLHAADQSLVCGHLRSTHCHRH